MLHAHCTCQPVAEPGLPCRLLWLGQGVPHRQRRRRHRLRHWHPCRHAISCLQRARRLRGRNGSVHLQCRVQRRCVREVRDWLPTCRCAPRKNHLGVGSAMRVRTLRHFSLRQVMRSIKPTFSCSLRSAASVQRDGWCMSELQALRRVQAATACSSI